jgi:aminoglycoside 3-N-acetyltransferase
MIDPRRIFKTIREMGVGSGDLLLAHSSYKSFGALVAGGPDAVVNALIESISPGGSLFIPTFNYGQIPYDPATTKSFDGIISETFRQLAGVIRSPHPTHPLAGVGPDAPEILRNHDYPCDVFGPGSPFWKLWQRNSWILLIGCGHESNSMIHVAEEMVQVPYLKRTRTAKLVRGDQIVEVTVSRPGCSNGFNKIDAPLRSRSAIIDAQVAHSSLKLMRAEDVVTTAIDMLRRDPAALLCDRCNVCDEARQIIHAARAMPQANSES